MREKSQGPNGWIQTATLILVVVASCLAAWRAIDKDIDTVALSQIAMFRVIDRMATRVTTGGWSYAQQTRFANELREMANHPIPAVEPQDFTPQDFETSD